MCTGAEAGLLLQAAGTAAAVGGAVNANNARKDAKAEAERTRTERQQAEAQSAQRASAQIAMQREALRRNSLFTGGGSSAMAPAAGRATLGV